MSIFATGGLLKEAHDVVGHTAKITLTIGRYNTKQTLTSLLGEVGLLENTLCGIYVRQIQSGARVARVEYSCQSYTSLKWPDHNSMHLIVGNVTDLAEIYRVDDFIVAIRFITIQILCLSAVTCERLVKGLVMG
jgi:hypothetical protein